eukprot:jgi/Mesvir1/5478/Mv15528-RA.1
MAAAVSTSPAINDQPGSADNKPGALPTMNSRSVAIEGSRVILEIGDREVFATLLPKGTFKVPGAGFCTMLPLIGAPFGSHFEVVTARGDTLSLHRIDAVEEKASADPQDAQDEEAGGEDKTVGGDKTAGVDKGGVGDSGRRDNRNLLDRNNAQTLSAEDIARLKSEGVTGDKLVEVLKSNSATFATKTEFSQEKYLKKKKKKHCLRVILRRATAHRICEAYFKKGDFKAGHIRVDALSLLLSLSNVFAGDATSVLVFENCAGLITGAVAERMGGFGGICSTYPGGKKPSLDIAKLFDMDHACYANIVQAPLELLCSSRAAAKAKSEPGPDAQRLKMTTEESLAKPAVAANGSAAAAVAAPSAADDAQGDKGADDAATAQAQGAPSESDDGAKPMDGVVTSPLLTIPADNTTNHPAGGSVTASADAAATAGGSGPGSAAEEGKEKGSANDGAAAAQSRGAAAGAADGQAGKGAETMAAGAGEGMPSGRGARDRQGEGREQSKGRASGSVSRFATPDELQRWGEQGFTSLLVANESILPLDAANALFGLLQPSAPFVFLHSYLQPLADCMLALQISRRATGMQIIEPWMREYQVLPSRTHPHMAMSGTGGYLLSGYVTAPEPATEPSSVTPTGGKKRGRF